MARAPFQTREPVDFVVVGSGAAGGILAKELSTQGFSVVVVEQGPHLKPADFEILEFGGGPKRKRYPLEFKLTAIGYAQSVVEGGKGPGSTVGLSYATRVLGVSDKATLAAWIQNRSTYEEEVQQATAVSGTKGKKKAMKKLSVNAGRVPSHDEVEHQVVAWINDLRSDEVSARVTTSMIKQKAVELHPMFFGPISPPHDLEESKRHRNKQAVWCRRFLARRRLCIRAVTRKGQKLPRGWAGIALGAVKDLRELRSHLPAAVNLCEGPGVGDGG